MASTSARATDDAPFPELLDVLHDLLVVTRDGHHEPFDVHRVTRAVTRRLPRDADALAVTARVLERVPAVATVAGTVSADALARLVRAHTGARA